MKRQQHCEDPDHDLRYRREKMKRQLYCKVTALMQNMDIPVTLCRKQFLRKFQALLTLRGFQFTDQRSIQSALEVILNFRRNPVRHEM